MNKVAMLAMLNNLLIHFSYLDSGLGYIVGSEVATLLGGWQWGMRVSGVLVLHYVFAGLGLGNAFSWISPLKMMFE